MGLDPKRRPRRTTGRSGQRRPVWDRLEAKKGTDCAPFSPLALFLRTATGRADALWIMVMGEGTLSNGGERCSRDTIGSELICKYRVTIASKLCQVKTLILCSFASIPSFPLLVLVHVFLLFSRLTFLSFPYT